MFSTNLYSGLLQSRSTRIQLGISKSMLSLADEQWRYWGFWAPGLSVAPSGAAGSFGFQDLANRLSGAQPDPQGYQCFWVAAGQTSVALSYRLAEKDILVISVSDMFLGKKLRSLSDCDFPTPTIRPGQSFVAITDLSLLGKDNCLLLQRTKQSIHFSFVFLVGFVSI